MIDIIRAWKDAKYRSTLTAEQLESIPANPAGAIELNDTELSAVTGGMARSSDLSSVLRTCTSGSDSCCC